MLIGQIWAALSHQPEAGDGEGPGPPIKKIPHI